MLALNSNYWVKKYSLSRYVNSVVTMINKMTLDTRYRYQHLSSMCEPTIRPIQPLGTIMNIHTSSLQCRNLLTKMLNLNNKRKKKWYDTPQSIPKSQHGFERPAKRKSYDSVRVRTLNVILYKALSDLLTSHEVNADIPNYDVEITKVSLTADFSACRVYWKTTWSPERDSKIQQVLDRSAPRIRYLLISQQVLSSTPTLVFLKDKQHAYLKEVDKLLEIADYGPSKDSEHLPLGDEDAEASLHSSEPVEEKKRPLFGIDHDALHKQIKDYKKQSMYPYEPGLTRLTQEQLDALAAFRKQRIIEKKKRKSKKVKDDDITPKAFLLERQQEEQEEDYSSEKDLEDIQAEKLMSEDDQKH